MINNAIVISDTHCGCKFGLCPPEFVLDEAVTVRQSKFQAIVWEKWNEFWDEWVPLVTRGEPYIVIHNGDAVDGVHHNAVTQITHNITDQIKIAVAAIKPRIERCAGYYHIRGTEAHVGQSGQWEEALAQQLGAIPDEWGNHARWEMWMRLGTQLVHFSHHVGTSSSAAYESTAVYKELVEAYNEAGRWGDEPPDAVIRSHRHRAFEVKIPTEKGYGFSIVTPAWQLKTPFTHRIALGRAGTPQIGGYLLRVGDEDSLYTRSKVWRIPRPSEVSV